MEWITANWGSIIAVITGIISVASIIAKLTPTEVDDGIVAKLLKLIDVLAINNKPTTAK
jgi:hypothetical protein